MALILITHDLGVIARMADDVVVMYAGQAVEKGSVDDIFYRSAHPYTMGLRAAMPTNTRGDHHKLTPIDGSPPDLFHPPAGCGYCARCPSSMNICVRANPEPFHLSEHHFARCWQHHPEIPVKADGLHYLTGND